MATKTTKTNDDYDAPVAAVENDKPPLPTGDEEFVFKDIESAPAWVDKGWAGYSNGPALQLPRDLWNAQPYGTITARAGDTVKFMAAKGSKPAHFEVIEGDASLDPGLVTKKPAQASAASLEDLIKLGHIEPASLGADAKAQVAARTPSMAKVVEGEEAAPEKQPVAVTADSA